MKLTANDFRSHRSYYDGYCVVCKDITREGGTEPDAENYECPECGEAACIGMDYALMGDHLEIVEDDSTDYEEEVV